MRKSLPLRFNSVKPHCQNLVQIQNGTFYRQHPVANDKDSTLSNPPLFRDLSFELPARAQQDVADKLHTSPHWAVIGTSGVTTFLEILRGTHISLPPTARTFPYLSSEELAQKDHRLRIPSRAIQYVGFNGGKSQGLSTGVRGAYLSARYESRREETDWSVMQYLKGETDLNPMEGDEEKSAEDALLAQVVSDLRLEKLVNMPVSNLSNGQTRRARIARALLGRPELLLLDEPFMGLDPPTLVTLSPMLRDLAYRSSPLLVLALRPQDPIPDWITHLAILGANHTVALMGPKAQVLFSLHRWAETHDSQSSQVWAVKMAEEMTKAYGPPLREVGHSLTAGGVVRYDPAEKMLNSPYTTWFNHKGDIAERVLDKVNLRKLDAALAVSKSERSLDDWLTITSILPKDLEGKSSKISYGMQQKQVLKQVEDSSKQSVAKNSFLKDAESNRGEPLIELSSVIVKYGDKTVLGHPPPQSGFTTPGLNLTIRRGTRLALLGPNGSGKTTLLSLLTSDHPHSYSLPIKFFGRSRLPSPGIPGLSLWEIQSRIGHSSPEIHAFFPRHLTIRGVLESAWAETFGGLPKLTYERDEKVDACLRWWEPELRQFRPGATSEIADEVEELEIDEIEEGGKPRRGTSPNWYTPVYQKTALWRMILQTYPPVIEDVSQSSQIDSTESVTIPTSEDSLDWAEDKRNHIFGLLPFGTQRLLLLLRATIKEPDILILDEAFSGLSPEVREKAMCWLEHGEKVFLQRRMVLPNQEFDLELAANGEDIDAAEDVEEDGPADPEGEETKRGRGRPRNLERRRPIPVPGRKPGRPMGSQNVPWGKSPWVSNARYEDHGQRWETVKVKNMRDVVHNACAEFDIDVTEFPSRGSSIELTKLREYSWAGLVDLAGQRPEGYRCTGLSEKQALVVVSHVREEVPGVVDEWLRLPGEEEVVEQGKGVEMGRCENGEIRTVEGWGGVWGLGV